MLKVLPDITRILNIPDRVLSCTDRDYTRGKSERLPQLIHIQTRCHHPKLNWAHSKITLENMYTHKQIYAPLSPAATGSD